jgi:predicted N-acyltransferase
MADVSFDIQVAHSVTEFEKESWDRLSNGRPFSSHRWYRFGEAVLVDSPPTYIVLSRDGEPVARGTFWLKRREWLPITSPIVRFGAERLLQRWPLFSCETPLASVSGLILPETSSRMPALEAIARTALELGKRDGALCTIFGYIPQDEALQVGWSEAFSALSFSDAETSLEITWPDFDSYLGHLAKSTRRNFRLHGKRASELEIVVTAQPGVSEIDRAVTLIQDVETYHQVGHRTWVRAMLENAHLVDATWIAACVDDRLVGCCSVLGDGDVQTATLLGLDYSFPESIYVYYQVIYAAIRHAIERGAKVLYGGGGAYELKRRLGFRTLPDDYLMVAASGRLFQWLIRGSARLIGSSSAEVEPQGNLDEPD